MVRSGARPVTVNGAEPVTMPDQSAVAGASGRPSRPSPSASWRWAEASWAALRVLPVRPLMVASARTVVADEGAAWKLRCRTAVR